MKPAAVVAEKKPRILEYQNAGRFGAPYLKNSIAKGDKVSEADVGAEVFERLLRTGWFTLVK